MNKQEILNRLNEITKSYSFLYIIGRIVLRDFCGSIDVLFSKNNNEHLNHNEFAFLVGLWIKNVDLNIFYDRKTEMEIFEETYHLMENLHFTFLQDFKFDPDSPPNFHEHFLKGGTMQESIFYSGTGAYDKQYTELVCTKYKHDIEWLRENKDFNLNSLPKFYDNTKDILQKKINNRRLKKNISDEELILEIFCLKKEEIVAENKDFENILAHLHIDLTKANNKNFNDLGDFNLYNEKPIIKINKDLYFIPSAFAISESMYESLYYWMLADKKYTNIAAKNRGNVAEEITKNIIEPVFGDKNIYQNIIINKTKNNQITDIDILAICNDSAIIFQIKSKKLTALSKKGNIESIKSDFKKAVQDAYDQAILSRKCLQKFHEFKFPFQDEEFKNRLLEIQNYLIVTIVLDDYPAITHQVHILLENNSEELPVAINIFDLALIAKYIPKPEGFIDYISQRSKYSKYFHSANEMGFLGFHLSKGLKKYDGDFIYLDESWAKSIDKKYYNEVYEHKIEKTQSKKIQRNDPCYCNSGLKYKKCHGKF
jgi:hypothetical protein